MRRSLGVEQASGSSIGYQDAIEDREFPGDVVKDSDHDQSLIADEYGGLLVDPAHVESSSCARPEHRQLLFVATEPEALLDGLASHRPRRLPKWVPRVRA